MTGATTPQPPAGRAEVAQWQRPLLPAGLLDETPGGRRSPRDWAVDACMYVVAIGIGVAALGTTASQHSGVGMAIDVAAGVVALGALWFRRRHPVGVAALVLGLSCFSALAAGAALAAAFNAALRVGPRTLWWIAAGALAAAVISPAFYGAPHGYDWQGMIIGVLLTVIVLGWGLFARAQRDLVRSLHDRTRQLVAERRLLEEQARDAERRRIAREMHDVLAHRISLLSVHAGALEFRPDAPREEIAEAAGVVRAAAHAALQDLRGVIGLLRDDADDAGASPGAGGPEPPQPTLAQVPALVEESRAAGMRVTCRIDAPDAEAMPAALGRTAYRIVQEGLTNARRHAPAAAVDVAIDGGEGKLMVSVVSRRPVGVAVAARDAVGAATGVGAGAGAARVPAGTGTGLIGLGERVALAGGSLEHGPDAEGDFVLRATLPWPA
jgi:signal transduction histidine kinase